MKKVLRLEWQVDPEGYRLEERQGGQIAERTTGPHPDDFRVERLRSPHGTFLVPRSGRLVDYAYDFDRTQLVYFDLINAIRSLQDTGLWDAILAVAKRWGLPNNHHEANLNELIGARPWLFARHAPWPRRETSLPSIHERTVRDVMYQLPKTLSGFIQYECILAFEDLNIPVGRCRHCGDEHARRIKPRTGEREFCRYKFGERRELIRTHCRQAFGNAAKKQEGALAPKRERVTWSRPNA